MLGAGSALRTALLLLLLAERPHVALGKLQTGAVRLDSDGEGQWQYLGKFGYAIGTGTYELRLRLLPARETALGSVVPRVDLDVFLDEEWDRARALPACQRAWDGPSRIKHHRLVVGPVGEWGPWQSSSVHQVVRPHIWYFALSDCYGQRSRPSYAVEYEIRWRQFDGCELGFELRHQPLVDGVALVLTTALVARLAARGVAVQKRSCAALHPVVQGLAAAVACQWLGQALRAVHLWVSAWNGVGLGRVDAAAAVLLMLSQVICGTLLLAISRGYTLLACRASQWRRLRPLAVAAAAFHVGLVCMARSQGETADTHHEHAGLLGVALLAARLALAAWFLAGVQEVRARSGFRLGPFLDKFQLAGMAYILALPIVWALAQVLAQYLRHLVVHVGMLTMQTCVAVWLAELFLSRGSYFAVSELSASLLPGGSHGLLPAKKAD